MIPVLVTVITGLLEIADMLFGSDLGLNVPAIEIVLAAITPILVWGLPQLPWARSG